MAFISVNDTYLCVLMYISAVLSLIYLQNLTRSIPYVQIVNGTSKINGSNQSLMKYIMPYKLYFYIYCAVFRYIFFLRVCFPHYMLSSILLLLFQLFLYVHYSFRKPLTEFHLPPSLLASYTFVFFPTFRIWQLSYPP